MSVEEIIAGVIEREGGYVAVPADRGGETKYGIAKRWHPELDIKNLTRDQAAQIYYDAYWIPSRAGQLPEDLQPVYFDMVVNIGPTPAVTILQKAINGKTPGRIREDGLMGPITVRAAAGLEPDRLRAYRALYYARLVLNEPDQQVFWYGWFKRAINV